MQEPQVTGTGDFYRETSMSRVVKAGIHVREAVPATQTLRKGVWEGERSKEKE
jgi:hypothetical protein